MKSIADRLEAAIKAEEKKNSSSKEFTELRQFLTQIQIQGNIQKPTYTLPLADTIGKTIYSNINKPLSL